MSSQRLLLSIIVAAAVVAWRPALGTDVSALDILGLRLGMSESEARAAAVSGSPARS